MSNEQEELFNAWLELRSYARTAIGAYSQDKARIEEQTQAFSNKWDSIKDEEKGWNTLLAVAEQKKNNVFAAQQNKDAPFPDLSLSTEEILKAIGDFISGVRPVLVGPQPEEAVAQEAVPSDPDSSEE
jgi:hypothetical protein